MNWSTSITRDFTTIVNWITKEVKHSSKYTLSNWNGNWTTCVNAWLSTSHTIGTTEGNAADLSTAEVLADLPIEGDLLIAKFNFRRNGVVDVRQITFWELGVES